MWARATPPTNGAFAIQRLISSRRPSGLPLDHIANHAVVLAGADRNLIMVLTRVFHFHKRLPPDKNRMRDPVAPLRWSAISLHPCCPIFRTPAGMGFVFRAEIEVPNQTSQNIHQRLIVHVELHRGYPSLELAVPVYLGSTTVGGVLARFESLAGNLQYPLAGAATPYLITLSMMGVTTESNQTVTTGISSDSPTPNSLLAFPKGA